MAILLSKIIPEVGMHHWTARNQRMWNHFTGFLIHIFIAVEICFFLIGTKWIYFSFSRHDWHEWKNQVLIKILFQTVGIFSVHWQRTRQDHYVHAFLHKITAIHSEPCITITAIHLWIFTYGDHFQGNSYAYLLIISSQSLLFKTNKNQEPTTVPRYCDWTITCYCCQRFGEFSVATEAKERPSNSLSSSAILFASKETKSEHICVCTNSAVQMLLHQPYEDLVNEVL